MKKTRNEYNERTASISNLLEYYIFIVSAVAGAVGSAQPNIWSSTIDDDANN